MPSAAPTCLAVLFEIENVPPGRYTLEVRKRGGRRGSGGVYFRQEIFATSGQPLFVPVSLVVGELTGTVTLAAPPAEGQRARRSVVFQCSSSSRRPRTSVFTS